LAHRPRVALRVRPTRVLPEIRGTATLRGARLVRAELEPVTSSAANANATKTSTALRCCFTGPPKWAARPRERSTGIGAVEWPERVIRVVRRLECRRGGSASAARNLTPGSVGCRRRRRRPDGAGGPPAWPPGGRRLPGRKRVRPSYEGMRHCLRGEGQAKPPDGAKLRPVQTGWVQGGRSSRGDLDPAIRIAQSRSTAKLRLSTGNLTSPQRLRQNFLPTPLYR
jgi:hypothetical protein